MKLFIKPYIIQIFMLISLSAYAQIPVTDNRKTTIGCEIDVLPYITGGYYGSVWIGHDRMRYRAIITEITTPKFFVKEGFTNNEIQAYSAVVDYFFRPAFRRWWVGAGVEYWKGSVQADAKRSTAKYTNTMLTFGTGHVWKFYNNFYLNPWAALHARIAGDSKVTVDDQKFTPPVITPEVSVKIGWHL